MIDVLHRIRRPWPAVGPLHEHGRRDVVGGEVGMLPCWANSLFVHRSKIMVGADLITVDAVAVDLVI